VSSYKYHKWILEREILLFILPSSTNDIWQMRFKNPLKDGARYIRKSTGHSSEGLATSKAIETYKEYQSRALLNLKVGKTTLAFLLDKFSHQFDDVSLKSVRSFNKTYWSKFIGDRDVSTFSSDDIEKYFKWRVSQKTETHGDETTNTRRWISSKTTISSSTLKLERNLMRQLFQIGHQHNYIARMPTFPRRFDRWEGVHKLPSNKRRGRFKPKEHYQEILMVDFAKISKALQKEEWKPVLTNPDLDFDPETNPYQSISKRDGRQGRETRSKVFCHVYDRYNYSTYWFMALLIANSGIRPATAARLRHRDIHVREDDDGKVYTLINVSAEISKTGKQRWVVCRDFHKTFERYLIYKDEIKYRFNKIISPDDWIFPSTNRREFYNNYRRLYPNLFRVHLQRLNLHKTSVEGFPGVEVFFSAYSFRSYYISQRLLNGLDLYTLSKNVGSSPKTIMSAYDYNENWEFRRKITQHYKSDPTSDCPEHIRGHIQYWR